MKMARAALPWARRVQLGSGSSAGRYGVWTGEKDRAVDELVPQGRRSVGGRVDHPGATGRRRHLVGVKGQRVYRAAVRESPVALLVLDREAAHEAEPVAELVEHNTEQVPLVGRNVAVCLQVPRPEGAVEI